MCRLFLLFAILGLSACQKPPKPLPDPRTSKELVVVTHNGPNTYYVDGNNQFAGLEYDLATLFARELGEDYTVKFVIADNITQVIPTLLKGKAHIAAADLSITHLRQHLVQFAVPYQGVQQHVVFNTEINKAPKKIEDLIGKQIAVPAGTSYAERLAELAQSQPELKWQALQSASADELMEQVAEGLLDYTISDSHLVAMLRNFYPNLGIGLALGNEEKIAWAFPKTGDRWLYDQANLFFARIQKDGTLRNLIDRYYGHSKRLDTVDVTTFLKRTRTLLPLYIDLFKQAQELTGLDWRLLAAISYRESHWDKLNTSPTNVRGLMMLTESTADLLGVTDRLDPRQSILGGARYIVMLKDTIPKRVPEPDRTWMALAAYNIGYAHLEDARVLAQRMKLNPDSWADVKKVLPLLNKVEYYSTLKYGFARGGAPVVFVESIRTYHRILEKYEPPHSPVLPSFNLAKAFTQANLVQ
ncbi:membrane-bound lytic murein transglycosylase F [Methylophilaceae bacterium]|nr:membrane-bound lytic murein transglycosylase F [Methylophilaceae bacterium]